MGGWLPVLIGEQFLTPLEGGRVSMGSSFYQIVGAVFHCVD